MKEINLDEMRNIILEYVIKEYIEDNETEITCNTPLISSGYLDSFSMASLLVFIENKFNVNIPPKQVTPETFNSVNKIVALINQYIN